MTISKVIELDLRNAGGIHVAVGMAVDDIEIHRRGFDVLDDAGSNKIQIAVLDKVASKACGIFGPTASS